MSSDSFSHLKLIQMPNRLEKYGASVCPEFLAISEVIFLYSNSDTSEIVKLIYLIMIVHVYHIFLAPEGTGGG